MKVLMIGDIFSNKNLNKSCFKNLNIHIDYAPLHAISYIEERINNYNLYFIDIKSNDFNWISFVKIIRSFSFSPIVIAIEKLQDDTQLIALDLNVTWFILKPFSPDFLLRIINKFFTNYTNYYKVGDFYFYKQNRHILIDQKEIPLTNKEYALLEFLIENRNTVLCRTQILDKIWGIGNGNLRLLDFHIKNLRKKLKSYSLHIITLNGVGYSWKDCNDTVY